VPLVSVDSPREDRDTECAKNCTADYVGPALRPPAASVDVNAVERPDDKHAERDRERQPARDIGKHEAPP
jgi:hypothetical protein